MWCDIVLVKKKRLKLRLIILSVLLCFLFGCFSEPYNIPKSMPERVKIVFVVPLSDMNSREGVPAKNAFLQAVNQANESERFPYYIEPVIIKETTDTAAMGTALLNALSGNDVFAVCGYWYSENVAAAIPVLREKKVPLLIWGAVGTELVSVKNLPYVTRICPVAEQSLELLYAFTAGKISEEKWFVVSDSSSYGRSNAKLFNELIDSHNAVKLGQFTLPSDKKQGDFTALVQAIKTASPSAIYFGGLAENLPGLRQALYEAGLGQLPFATSAGTSLANIADTSDIMNGVYTVNYGTNVNLQWGTRFMDDYRQANYSELPGVFTGFAYDAAMVIVQALENILLLGDGVPTPKKIAEEIAGINCPGLLGEISFDEKGQAPDYNTIFRPFVMRNGQWTETK